MYLLDTSVLSELRKLQRHKADQAFTGWFSDISLETLYISIITLFEVEHGILLLERRDPGQAQILRNWFENTKVQFQGRVLSVDQDVASFCARICVPNPRSWRDALIGATARSAGLILVTRNTRDFERIDIDLINPWLLT